MQYEPVPLHPLLAARFSPVQFDPTVDCTPAQAESILEAARWAPSAGNSQPWAFITGLRGSADHARLVRYLAASSARWAPQAGLLVANLCHRYVEDTDWDYSEFAMYDLGQAVAHMVVQAQSLGMSARQFRAFDRFGLEREFAVPAHWSVTTMAAFGYPADDPAAPAEAQPVHATRQRRSLSDLAWPPPPR
jgi:nitroreductase